MGQPAPLVGSLHQLKRMIGRECHRGIMLAADPTRLQFLNSEIHPSLPGFSFPNRS
jgi:hypothetical protein